jgi:hypothetical protein
MFELKLEPLIPLLFSIPLYLSFPQKEFGGVSVDKRDSR